MQIEGCFSKQATNLGMESGIGEIEAEKRIRELGTANEHSATIKGLLR